MLLDFPKRHSIIIQIHAKSYFLLMISHPIKTIIKNKSVRTFFALISLYYSSMLRFSLSIFLYIFRITSRTSYIFILLLNYIFGFHFGFNGLMNSKRVFTHPLSLIPIRYNLLSKLNYLNLSFRRYNPIGKFIKKRINIVLWQDVRWRLLHISAIDVGINGYQEKKKNQLYAQNVKVHIGISLVKIIRKKRNENNT